MEKLKALYESYIEQGLLSKETSFEQFSQSDLSIQEALYNQGLDEKIISSETISSLVSCLVSSTVSSLVVSSTISSASC